MNMQTQIDCKVNGLKDERRLNQKNDKIAILLLHAKVTICEMLRIKHLHTVDQTKQIRTTTLGVCVWKTLPDVVQKPSHQNLTSK